MSRFRALMMVIFLTILFSATLFAITTNNDSTDQSISPTLNASSTKTLTETASRGKLLYENHCMVCHTSVVHVREKRQADSISEIYSWVSRWSTERKLEWQRTEIEAVVEYLNSRYYKFTAKK